MQRLSFDFMVPAAAAILILHASLAKKIIAIVIFVEASWSAVSSFPAYPPLAVAEARHCCKQLVAQLNTSSLSPQPLSAKDQQLL